jgi:hypothetical protein
LALICKVKYNKQMKKKFEKGDIVKVTFDAIKDNVCMTAGRPINRPDLPLETYFDVTKIYTIKQVGSFGSIKPHERILVEGSTQYVHEDYFILVSKASDKNSKPQYVKSIGDCIEIHGIKYEVSKSSNTSFYLANTGTDANALIFTNLDIRYKNNFISNVVGYSVHSGDFPFVKSIEDINKVIDALINYNKTGSKKLIGYKVKSGFFNVAHRAIQKGLGEESIIAVDSPIIIEAESYKILDIWFEPVFKDAPEIIYMANGGFQLTIEDGKVFHRDEDISKFVKELVEYFQLPEFGKHTCNIKNLTFSNTGCENIETNLEEWKKIYSKINRVI